MTEPAPIWLAPVERALRPWLRRIWRGSLSRDALLTLTEVVDAIPGADAEVRAWIRLHVPPRTGPCGELWRWGDVLDATQKPPGRKARPARQVPAGLQRVAA